MNSLRSPLTCKGPLLPPIWDSFTHKVPSSLIENFKCDIIFLVGRNRFVDEKGYVLVRLTKDDPYYYPMADNRGYVYEHRLVMARHLERYLEDWEEVHHKNGNTTDNRIDNLKLIDPRLHHALHPKPRGKVKPLEHDEIKSLLSVIKNKRDNAIFLLAYYQGLGPSQIPLIKVEDIDLNRWGITIRPKNRSQGGDYHRLNKREVQALKAWLKEKEDSNPYLFPSNRGKPISRRTLHYLMEVYAREADIPKDKRHFSVLKHSLTTHLLEAGRKRLFSGEEAV